MSFSYRLHEGLPSDRDEVRFLLGDTDEGNFNLHDEEIDFLLSEEPNKYFAAAAGAEATARKLQAGFFEDQKVGETRLRTKRINELIALSNQLRSRGATHQLPFSGGISKASIEKQLNNTDTKRGDFFTGMNDYPGTTKRSRPANDTFNSDI